MADGLTHFDDAPSREFDLGHLRSRWTFLGEAAGSVTIGLRRMEVAPGGWTTPVHDHGRAEEIFYVLGGEGISWQRGRTAPVRAGDCVVYHPRRGEHGLRSGEEGLDLLAFGPREYDEALRLPRLDASLINGRAVASEPGTADGYPFQFVREGALGPPAEPETPGERPPTIVNLIDVPPERLERARVARTRRKLSAAAGSRATGLQHVEVEPGRESAPPHCHSLEEELFVVLTGAGVLDLGPGDAEYPLRAGSVVSRPAATGVAHTFRAGADGLSFLAYGPRQPNDLCWYPRSDKIAFRGLGVIARIERLDYWDGEG